jgi:hypothetical protein
VSGNSVGKTPVSGALGQCEAELVRCGVMEGTFGLKLVLELRVCKPPSVGATVKSELKMEIPAKFHFDGTTRIPELAYADEDDAAAERLGPKTQPQTLRFKPRNVGGSPRVKIQNGNSG